MTRMETIEQAWLEAETRTGHQFQLNEQGDVDWVALCYDEPDGGRGHNGPQCVLCGDDWCMFCTDSRKLKTCGGKP